MSGRELCYSPMLAWEAQGWRDSPQALMESTCASLVITASVVHRSSTTIDEPHSLGEAGWGALLCPCVATVKDQPGIEKALTVQMTLTATVILVLPCIASFPKEEDSICYCADTWWEIQCKTNCCSTAVVCYCWHSGGHRGGPLQPASRRLNKWQR